MEHESFVPMPSGKLAAALRTPGTVPAALPGWQPDGDAPAGERTARGRLRLRVAGSTITYRGFVAVEGDGSPFALVAHGTEARGTGEVRVSATIALRDVEQPEPGTLVVYAGTADVTGRLASYDPALAEAAVRRLLDRFSSDLAARAPSGPEPAEAAEASGDAAEDGAEAAAEEESGAGAEAEHGPDASADASTDAGTEDGFDEEEPDVVDDLGEPSPDLEEFDLVEVEVEVPESAAALDDLVPTEAAHARRTMIGRSAEEVDHAPPRGRYAPVPAPGSSSAAATLRWAAPAAAALLASAVVVGRVLRRRR